VSSKKGRLIQLILLAQAGIGVGLGLYLSHALRVLYDQQFPWIVHFSGENYGASPFVIGLIVLVMVPLLKGVLIAAAVIWWLSQQRKILEQSEVKA
jgi:hypothetical protein